MQNLNLVAAGPVSYLPATAAGLPTSPRANNLDAFWEYIGACTARGAAAPNTRKAYGAAIAIYLDWCAGRQLEPAAAQRRDIEDWRADRLAAGDAAGTVALRLAAVRTLYKALQRAGRVTENPADHVKSPKAREATVDAVMRKVVFTDQMKVVLAALGEDARADRDRALLLTMYLLGLRVSEVQGLDWKDWGGDTLAFTAKGGQARELSVPEGLKAVLAKLRGAGTEPGPVFLGAAGRLTVRGIQKMVAARLAAGGQAGRSPHALRHSCATTAAIAGSNLFAIQDQLGHADQRTTAIYTRVAGRFLEAPSLAVARGLGI